MRNLFLACLSLLTLSSSAQVSNVNLSEEFKIKNFDYKDQVIKNSVFHNDHFYSISNSGVGGAKWLFTKLYDLKFDITIAQYDKNMKEVKEVKLDNGADNFGPFWPSMFILQNKLFAMYFKSENKTSFDLYMGQVDEKNLAITNKKKICTINQENVGVFKLQSVFNSGMVYVSNSSDGNKVLIACKTSPGKLTSHIVDGALNIERKTEMAFSDPAFQVTSAVLSKNNLECMAVQSERDIKLVYVNPDGKKSQKAVTNTGLQMMLYPTLKLSEAEDKIFLYSATNNTGVIDEVCNGFAIAEFDCNSFQLSKPSLYRFNQQLMDEFALRDGKKEKRSIEYSYFFSPVLYELSNKQLVLAGSPEVVQKTSGTTMDSKGRNEQYVRQELKAGSIYVFQPDMQGKEFKHVSIPRKVSISKSQSSGSGYITFLQAMGINNSASSFIAKSVGDGLVLLYNDNEANLEEDRKKLSDGKNTKDLVLTESLVKDNQVQYRKKVGEDIKGVGTYYINDVIQNSTGKIIFPVGKEGVGFTKQVFSNWCFVSVGP